MTDAIIVVNAGSTSLKFAAYATDVAGSLPLLCRGQIDGMQDDPHFVANNPAGNALAMRMNGAKATRSITRRRFTSSSPGWKPTSRA